MEELSKDYNFEAVRHVICHCGTRIPYNMKTIIGFVSDIPYVECPYCNTCHSISAESFKIKKDE